MVNKEKTPIGKGKARFMAKVQKNKTKRKMIVVPKLRVASPDDSYHGCKEKRH